MQHARQLRHFALACLLAAVSATPAAAQSGSSDLRVFGYFQPMFLHQNGPKGDGALNSFSLQQLNLFFQKDLGPGLTSFVNLEAVNSFSTRDGWGHLRIEEAWVRYRRSSSFNLRVGLQIPTFNNFNEIKNRTPLIPYVIRPLVYESSLTAQINNPLYVPEQAFVQAFGWLPLGSWKFDYATYVGNTDNVVSSLESLIEGERQIDLATGMDSSAAVLFGARIGVRKGDFKVGFSATIDRTNLFAKVAAFPGIPPDEAGNTPRYRSGFDLSFHIGRFWFENESIGVYTSPFSGAEATVGFTYLTVGYRISERLQGYLGYQIINQRLDVLDFVDETDIWLPTGGLAYTIEDQITLKAQYAYVVIDVHNNLVSEPDPKFHHFTLAVSVSF